MARGESVFAHPDSGAGYACLHVAVDDRGRVACAEPLSDEKKGACAVFMGCAPRLCAGLGLAVERVMTDNGPGYLSGEFNALLEAAGARYVNTRPYSPWQNGKVERLNRTIAQEWRYGRAWGSEAGRASALPAFIEHYNRERPHSACGSAPYVMNRQRKQPVGTQRLGFPMSPGFSALDSCGCRGLCSLRGMGRRKSARCQRTTKT